MNEVASYLGAAVNRALDQVAHDHPRLAQALHWPVSAVDKNPAHARELMRLQLARHAVAAHVSQFQPHSRPPPAPQNRLAAAWDRGVANVRKEIGEQAFAVTHPIEALANHIHNNRLPQTERHLARGVDILGGSVAGMTANTVVGLAKIADLYHRYGPGQTGLIEDALAKQGLAPPPPRAAEMATKAVEPLQREERLRPPTTLAGKALAAAPNVLGAIIAPEVLGTTLLAAQGVGHAYTEARQNGAPDDLRTDLGITGTGIIDAAGARVLRAIGRMPDPARFLERLPEELRSDALELVARVATKSAAGAAASGVQTGANNIVAKGTFDPERPWARGVAESLLFGGLGAAPFGIRGRARPAFNAPEAVAPPRTRPRTIGENKAAGDAWEIQGREIHAEPVQHSIQPQITMRSKGPSQTRVRLDLVGIHKETGQMALTEFKASDTAPLTSRQKDAFPELASHGGVVVGKGKPPYIGGTQVPPTKVAIIRKPRS